MKNNDLNWLDKYDRISINDDGSKFYGFDDEETGTTIWYDEEGNCDSVTETPSNDWEL